MYRQGPGSVACREPRVRHKVRRKMSKRMAETRRSYIYWHSISRQELLRVSRWEGIVERHSNWHEKKFEFSQSRFRRTGKEACKVWMQFTPTTEQTTIPVWVIFQRIKKATRNGFATNSDVEWTLMFCQGSSEGRMTPSQGRKWKELHHLIKL